MPRLEWARSGEPGNAEFLLGLCIEGLELPVLEGPVSEAGAADRSPAALLDKIDLVKAPVVRGEVNSPAAYHPTVNQGRFYPRFFAFSDAEGIWLALGIIHERSEERVFYFVVMKIAFTLVRSLFKYDHLEAGCRELLRH